MVRSRKDIPTTLLPSKLYGRVHGPHSWKGEVSFCDTISRLKQRGDIQVYFLRPVVCCLKPRREYSCPNFQPAIFSLILVQLISVYIILVQFQPNLQPDIFSMRPKRKDSALGEQPYTLWWPPMDRMLNALMTGPTGTHISFLWSDFESRWEDELILIQMLMLMLML